VFVVAGWMEPINNTEGIEAARLAAVKTIRSTQDKPAEEKEVLGCMHKSMNFVIDIMMWPADFAQLTMVPMYRKQRNNVKKYVKKLLFGNSPFFCKIRITGINLLVFCSFVFLFLEVVNLAFLPAHVDDEVAIVGL
jgi:hypothetical protein